MGQMWGAPFPPPPPKKNPTDVDAEAGGGVEVGGLPGEAAVLLVHIVADVGQQLAHLAGHRGFGVPFVPWGGRGGDT